MIAKTDRVFSFAPYVWAEYRSKVPEALAIREVTATGYQARPEGL
jgi:hypothetical protein